MDVRASDAERDATVDRLRDAATEGRLTLEEFTDRIEAAANAVTRSDLVPLLEAGRAEEARRAYEDAANLDPLDPGPWRGLAAALDELGHTKQAALARAKAEQRATDSSAHPNRWPPAKSLSTAHIYKDRRGRRIERRATVEQGTPPAEGTLRERQRGHSRPRPVIRPGPIPRTCGISLV